MNGTNSSEYSENGLRLVSPKERIYRNEKQPLRKEFIEQTKYKVESTVHQKLRVACRIHQVWVKQFNELLTIQIGLAMRETISHIHFDRCTSYIPHRSMTSSISVSSVNKQLRFPLCCSSRRSWSSLVDLTVWILVTAHLPLTTIHSPPTSLTTSLISEPKDFDTLWTLIPQSLKKSFLQLIRFSICIQWFGHLDRRQINHRLEL